MSVFFSVLVPTKNRAHLLDEALKNLLKSPFRNFEVIVSDDSVDEGATKKVVEKYINSHADIKIAYVKPPHAMSMLGNFNYALKYACGEFVTALYDDDVILPSALGYLRDVVLFHQGIDVLVIQMTAIYYHKDVAKYDSSLSGAFSTIENTGTLFKAQTSDYMQLIAGFGWYDHGLVMPKSGNCIMRRSLMERCINESGVDFYTPPYPDFGTACHIAGIAKYFYILDLPLYISGASALSNSVIIYDRKAKWEYYLKLIDEDMLQDSSCPIRHCETPYFEYLIKKFSKLYPSLRDIKINYDNFFRKMMLDLYAIHSVSDENLAEEMSILQQSMERYYGSSEKYREVYKEVFQKKESVVSKSGNSIMRSIIRKIVNTSDLAHNALSMVFKKIKPGYHLRMYKNFETITDATTYMEKRIRKQLIAPSKLKIANIDSPEDLVKYIHH